MDTTEIAVQLFDKHALSYQQRFMDVSLYHDTFNTFLHSIKDADATVLELTCGPGNVTKYLLDHKPTLQILATDLSPAMVALARANNPAARVDIMDCRNVSSIQQTFDAVMFGFGLPYLCKEDASKLIADVGSLLITGGVFYLSTMEDEYNKSGIQTSSQGDQCYMYFYEENFLVDALLVNRFSIIDVQRKNTLNNNQTTTTDLVIISRKL